jgi:putative spermidine/putrescine transport system permease protein
LVLAIAGSLQSIHPDVELAARSLGGSPWRAFWRVTWPLSMPGVYSGTLLVFILAVSSYVIPILLGGSNILMAPQMIVQMVLDAFNWPLGAAMAMWVFLVVVTIVAAYVKVMSRVLRWTA